MFNRIVRGGLLLLAFAAAPAAWAQSDPAAIPRGLQPPAQNVRHLTAYATGSQIYVCTAQPDNPYSFGWTFKGPEAELRDGLGEKVGTHYDGPTWEWNDGSTVVGRTVERVDARSKDTIPWLLLRVMSAQGAGQLAPVSYIQRIGTVGGNAPSDGCDQSAADVEQAVPYAATYVFYALHGDAQ
jgi:hypothetical protein